MSKQLKVNRRTVMAEANALVKGGTMTRSDAVKQGYKLARLYAIFAAGAMASITFLKGSGEKRPALALPARTGEYLVKGTGRDTPKANVLYWDVGKSAFRSFCKARLLSVS